MVEPGTDNAFALILPDANSAGMQAFLDAFAKTIADDEHVALVLDGAGWHSGKALRVPENITLVPLPAYSPELNPVERVWLYLKQRFLSLRLLNDYKAIVAAASKAWKRLSRETGRLTSHETALERILGDSAEGECPFRRGDGERAGGLHATARSGAAAGLPRRDLEATRR